MRPESRTDPSIITGLVRFGASTLFAIASGSDLRVRVTMPARESGVRSLLGPSPCSRHQWPMGRPLTGTKAPEDMASLAVALIAYGSRLWRGLDGGLGALQPGSRASPLSTVTLRANRRHPLPAVTLLPCRANRGGRAR
jgi:hypothetical protein